MPKVMWIIVGFGHMTHLGFLRLISNLRLHSFQRDYYITLTKFNLLTLLVVIWLTFVILVDRVFGLTN